MTVTLDRELQRPRWNSLLLGGEAEFSAEQLDHPDYANLIHPNAPVVIEDLQGEFYLARMDEPGGNFAPQASMLSHLARGYADSARDQTYHDEQTWPAGTTLESIFTDTLAKCPQLAGTALISYLGRTLDQESPDFQGRNPQDVWLEVQRYGNSLSQPIIWTVGAHPTAGGTTPYLQVRPRPTTPTLFVELAELDAAPMKWPLNRVYNRVIVRYKTGVDTTATVVVDDTTSQAAWPTGVGVTREYYKDVSSRIDNVADATAFASTLLNQLKTLRPVGTQLSLTWPHRITDEFDQPVAIWRTSHLVGQIIRILSLTIDGPYERDQLIVAAAWDDHSRRLSLSTEQISSQLELWGQLQEAQDSHIEQMLEDAIEDVIDAVPGIIDSHGFTSVTDAELPNMINWSNDPTPGLEGDKAAREGHSHRLTTNRISIPFVHGDGTNDITTGIKGSPEIGFPCNVVGWRLVLVGGGSISLTVTIGASSFPIVSSSPDVDLDGLAIPVPAETTVVYEVIAVSDIQQFSLTLRADRTDP